MRTFAPYSTTEATINVEWIMTPERDLTYKRLKVLSFLKQTFNLRGITLNFKFLITIICMYYTLCMISYKYFKA